MVVDATAVPADRGGVGRYVDSLLPALVEVGGGATVTVPVGDSGALAEALRDVLDSPARRAELAAAGGRRAQDFSWTAAAARLWELYGRLL